MTEAPLPESTAEIIEVGTIRWYRQKFAILIMGAIMLAVVLTSISLYLYNTSIAAQLDLSQPGYESVRAGVEDNDIQSFESTGVITRDTIDQFEQLYNEQMTKTKSNQFSSNALTNRALGLSKIPD